MKKFIPLAALAIVCLCSFTPPKKKTPKKPKLVVGVVIDQMRYDYLTRFASKYGADGFNRLLNEGFSLENAHYNYIPTYTAVGHTSIYTGTTPINHAIISNNWYDKYLKKSVYCVDDSTYKTVGNNGDGGKKSPNRMLTTTITDQLRLAQNMNGKTIGIAIKDRSAILPAGHTANGAYWFDGGSKGDWITSSYYMDKLPKWVQKFNKAKIADAYLSQPWETLYNINTYTESIADDNNFEQAFKGEKKPVFPHNIPKLRAKNNNYSIIKGLPAGNSLTTDFAKAAIIGENLGQSDYTDFLAVSYSSTDYVGHQFGVASKEIEDTYLRLDKDLASLFQFLDAKVGKGNYTLFLTADHAAVQVPAYLQSVKIPANYFSYKKFTAFVNDITKKYFNSDALVENISNFQIFLDKDKIESLNLNKNEVAQKIADQVINYKGIYKTATARTLQTTSFTTGILNSLQNGYNQKFSGDVMLVPTPSTVSYPKKGTTHGSGYSYDTHIPVIFYGNGIKKGASKKKYEIVDIAPTLSNLLQIEFPNGSTGKVIEEVLN
ncbi:alkaline phosphatase PafA [Tenacibaculum finnmarkense]|uniref:Alkaline phosphatase family protein n=1 Tax=Tenacibaculum finnmarkense genomovar finnmarkense TaxID=1458503 RepID=A0AAP1WFT4_9FLAO|nr:alkaline phosphatase PafA [Tenacibaculum finnmarkense]MBE7652171.1 alkaline phosphatase family protein [Tenacibaculum finnmarkense genomovar finnmarkense]MBE7687799.1 alkaline phosphatase family protein [Tenacibaculum finnmarkense genomovar ulcerans]MBE7694657.1 alkaline phosphatase family protein [Tenacibaculum finnmarkense genomovar finnmarkense]MCD8426845.1 alkaline phosphatase family protein [Tenacibaculum finnmarkense genomovar finnmarkense]MCD8440177.1 alkaline phosphatase family prot